MRNVIFALALGGSMLAMSSGPALADVSPTQSLPPAACNQGTMNAHNHIPETTGTGATTPGHMAVPGTANQSPSGCGHGG